MQSHSSFTEICKPLQGRNISTMERNLWMMSSKLFVINGTQSRKCRECQ